MDHLVKIIEVSGESALVDERSVAISGRARVRTIHICEGEYNSGGLGG